MSGVLVLEAKTGGKGGVLDGELAPEIYETIELAQVIRIDC